MMRSNVPRTRMSAPASRTTPVRSKSSTTNRMPCAAKAILQRHGKRILVQNPPAKPADHRRDGSRLCAAVYANLSSVLRSARRRARYSGGAVLHHPQPRLLRRVQLLRAGVPSGTVHSGAQPRERDREEAKRSPKCPDSRATSHDVGGPTAISAFRPAKNRRNTAAAGQALPVPPTTCQNIEADHTDYLELLRELRRIEA